MLGLPFFWGGPIPKSKTNETSHLHTLIQVATRTETPRGGAGLPVAALAAAEAASSPQRTCTWTWRKEEKPRGRMKPNSLLVYSKWVTLVNGIRDYLHSLGGFDPYANLWDLGLFGGDREGDRF